MTSQNEATAYQPFVISANVRNYDIINHFAENKTVLWKQPQKCNAGDIVYVYVGAPYSRICYKCVVEKVNCKESDDQERYYAITNANRKPVRVMELLLVEQYESSRLGHSYLREHGLRTVQYCDCCV